MDNLKYKLILANGAFKSGSTWLREIVRHAYAFEPIPPAYADRKWDHWISRSSIGAFLSDPGFPGPCLSKSHLFRQSDIAAIKDLSGLGIINISRDIRDAVVSAYYHYIRQRNSKWTFKQWYWRMGRMKAVEILEYQNNWNFPAANVLQLRFEALKADFEGEAGRILDFIGVRRDPAVIDHIRKMSSIENMRAKRNESDVDESRRFFRKGIVGDWKNHFDERMLADLDRLSRGQLTLLDKVIYFGLFQARRALSK
jgi:hypothetical protein